MTNTETAQRCPRIPKICIRGLTVLVEHDILSYMDTRATQHIIDNIWSQRVALNHAKDPRLVSSVGHAIDIGLTELAKRAESGDPAARGFLLMDRAY